jgi:lysophospholipase L1-like esterase
MKKLAVYCLLLGITFTHNLWASTAELTQLPVHVGGRVLVETNVQGEKIYAYSWPSIYFETAFKGDSLIIKFDDDQNYFQLIVDNGAPTIIKKPGKLDYQVQNLQAGKHSVRLEKITETQSNTGRLLGFYTSEKSKALAPPKRKRSIEFIGDSFTVGYGNTSPSQECTNEDVYATTHSQLAFGPLVAKHFNADYQINASSGFGIVRNYNGSSPDKNLIGLYPFTLHNNSYIYAGDWKPQVIVIGLGTNDFSTKLNAGERWKTRAELQQDFVNKYTVFVKALHTKNPKAQFILMASDQTEGEIATQVGRVIATLKSDGLKKIDSIIFKGLDYKGCHWHPSVNDDKLIADLLIDYLTSHKIW